MINPLFLILQSISGGVAGYITNKYAVNMLFKEYTPLKLGGVVKKNKDKFIDEVSTLVEKDIINGNTLKEHISGEIFKNQINITVEEFWNNGLTEAFENIKIRDIASFEESKESLIEFTEEKVKLVAEEALKNIINNIEIHKFLSKNQIQQIVESIYEVIIKYLNEDKKIEEMFNDIYLENTDLILQDLINEDLAEVIKNKMKSILLEALENVFNDKDKLTDILQQIYEVVDLDTIIHKLFNEIGSKSLNDYLSVEEKNNVSKKFLDAINNLVKSEKGNEGISTILNEIVKMAEKLDFTLYELLPVEATVNFSEFIEEMTAKVLPSLSKWILFNKNEVNKMIEESIDSSIEGMDGAIKRIIIQKVRESLFSDISEKASVVERIVSYIEEYELNEDSSKKIAQFIINYLKENKVKDVISKLKKSNILSEENIKSLSSIIIEKFDIHGEKIVNTVIETIFSKEISIFINEERVNNLTVTLKNKLNCLIIKNSDEILKRLKIVVVKAIEIKGDEILHSKISSFVSEEEFKEISKRCNNGLEVFLKESKEKLTAKVVTMVTNKISQIDLGQLLDGEKEELSEVMVKLIVNLEENVINKYSDHNINELINDVCNKEKLTELSNEKVYDYLNKNIETMLKGNVKKIIYDNLIKFNEDEICDLAQSFMGNELKPLSLFGGVLGLIVGLIYGFFASNVSLLGFSGSIGSTIISCVIMALIGVSTNVIALKMLFYPYKRNKFLAKIPFLRKFSLGYIPAHKDTMARGIGQVIDEQLLNGEKVEVILNSKRDSFKGYLISSIAESNYKVIVDNIAIRKEGIVKYIYQSIKDNIEKNKQQLASNLGDSVDLVPVGKIFKVKSLFKYKEMVKDKEIVLKEKIADYLAKKMKINKPCSDLFSNKYVEEIKGVVKSQIEDSISKRIIDLLHEENIEELICNSEERYKLLINNSLKEIISVEKSLAIKEVVKDKSLNFIFKESKLYLESIIREFLESEIDGEKTIGNVFGGKVATYIDMNIPKLSRYLISKAESYLKDNRESFSMKIRSEITASLNFLERGAYMMFGGDAIVNRCVNTMIDIKVPEFLDNKYLEITSVVQSTLTYSVYPTGISELKLKANEINYSKVLDSIFVGLNDSEFIKTYTEVSIDEIVSFVLNENIAEMLSIVNLNSLKGILNKFTYEINLILGEAQNNLKVNLPRFKKYIAELVEEEIIAPMSKVTIGELTEGISKEHLVLLLNLIYEKIVKSESFNEKVEDILIDFYNKELKDKSLNNFVNKVYITQYAEEYIENTFKKDDFNNSNIYILGIIFDEIVKHEFNFTKEHTKNDIICRVIDGILEAVINNTSELLKAANLKKVTMEQIAIMEPKEIHMLFEGFAGEFFKKLYLYGSFGAIFGINLWLSIIWGVIEEINNKKTA